MTTQKLAELFGVHTQGDWTTTLELWAIPVLALLVILAVVALKRRWLIAVFNALVAVPVYDAFIRHSSVRTVNTQRPTGRHRVLRAELVA